MTRRKKSNKMSKRSKEEEKVEVVKNEEPKRSEDISNKINSYFKTEEIQDIRGLLNTEELGDHHCFAGAVVIGKFEVVKRLLREGHSIDFFDENRETAVMLAVRHFRLDMVDFLVTRGADISLVDGEGNNVMLLAAINPSWDQDSFSGLWHSVRDHPRLRPDHANKAGYRLIHYITRRQWKGMLEQLIGISIDLDCKTNKGVTPLILAASRGDTYAVKALLNAGADFTLEDQQKCTALCYAIAFSLQKNVREPNGALELILAAVNEGHSKMTLEQYLKRRLELLVNPPKNRAEFTKVVTSVLVHVLIFFARYIYSGMDLLMELSVFSRLQEAVMHHTDDPAYLAAVLLVVLELIRHCDCCCQGLSQAELANAFFSAGLGKCFLDLLVRYGADKTTMIKSVFQPLLYLCTSESYKARTWLEGNYVHLQPFYHKYMRSFPVLFQDTYGDTHAEIERQHSLSFQRLMKALKSDERIVTEEEHRKAAQKTREGQIRLARSMYSVVKPKSTNFTSIQKRECREEKLNVGVKRKSCNQTLYNSIIQHNFGKLDLAQAKPPAQPIKEPKDISIFKKEEIKTTTEASNKKTKRVKKSRIAIKEIREYVSPRSESSQVQECSESSTTVDSLSVNSVKTSPSNEEFPMKKSPLLATKERFSEGYQLFQLDEPMVVSDEERMANTCDWIEAYTEKDEGKEVSDVEVTSTLQYLEEIFNRILQRYDSTWTKQYMEGYLGAQGDSKDLTKLMSVLPALETYHMKKLMSKWDGFMKEIKNNARKNHVVYAALVSEMQLFLLEFEDELDKRGVKVLEDDESSLENDLDTEFILRNKDSEDLNILSNGKPVETLLNKNTTVQVDLELKKDTSAQVTQDVKSYENKTAHFVDSIYISDSEDESDGVSVWETKTEDKVEKQPETDKVIDGEGKTELDKEIVCTKEVKDKEINVKVEEEKEEMVTEIPVCTENTNNDKVESSLIEINLETSKDNDICETSQVCNVSNKDSLEAIESAALEDSKEEESAKIDSEEIVLQKKKPEDIQPDSEEKTPPGFEKCDPLGVCLEKLASLLKYCGQKYESQCLRLLSLPDCKTEFLDGGNVRISSYDCSQEFKLFTGFNLGNVELGLSVTGMPIAARRFLKLGNKSVSEKLCECVKSLLRLDHVYILPYLGVYDTPPAIITLVPLCRQDLGQYLIQIRSVLTQHTNSAQTINPYLVLLSCQLMEGLHYLHTKNIVHGNLKPSNIMVDANGTIRLAEFGLQQVLFQQCSPNFSSQIWWARECQTIYFTTWKYICTELSDIQTAGMLLHFIMTVGIHPYGCTVKDIMDNMRNNVIQIRTEDVVTSDLVCWMLCSEAYKRPSTTDVLRHVFFWDTNKRWNFLRTCCGKESDSSTFDIVQMHKDLDILSELRDIHSKWITVLQQYVELKTGCNQFADTPSGLLKFLKENIDNLSEVKELFLKVFAYMPLNLYRMLEQTDWIKHPVLEPFTKVELLSKP
ncbi:uncharacterized protein LOC129003516 [Macrosteles quadrilineatus]|uniref:uncharacterized protein LOC129003516 n=2 Tax=Macrosteles quadrilineatus TaxID=74068 RepID=UPI0023E3287F|nr:uncharacterized protein LOC129003516 [Macrosteles quadrilineatus]